MLYKLSRFSKVHNFIRVIGNNILWRLPYSVKYGVGKRMRRGKLPYRTLQPGDTVVQIGAPWDLLEAGRSRGITFSLVVGDSGRVIIIEPDEDNVKALHAFIQKRGITNVTVVPLGAWNKKDTLRFLTDPEHPASNLIADVYDEKRTDMDKYEVTEVKVDSLDNILAAAGVDKVKLLSITTNGAEAQILEGLSDLERVSYISVVGHFEDFANLPERGFDYASEDDRGYLFKRCS